MSGTVYYYDEKLLNLVAEVNRLTLFTNPLHSDVFPGVIKMEAEIIKAVADLFHGTSDACGSVCTSISPIANNQKCRTLHLVNEKKFWHEYAVTPLFNSRHRATQIERDREGDYAAPIFSLKFMGNSCRVILRKR